MSFRTNVRTSQRTGQVRTLEGTLADYNIAMDKQRQGSDVSELHGYIREYDAKNKAFAKEIDMVFLAKQQEEKAIGGIEEQVRLGCVGAGGVWGFRGCSVRAYPPFRLGTRRPPSAPLTRPPRPPFLVWVA